MTDWEESAELVSLRDWLRFAVSRFNEEGLYFGHGCTNAHDEAAYLLLHTLNLPLDRLDPYLDGRITCSERERIRAVLRRRLDERVPAAYLTHEAWLGEARFYVDQRVIIPRSFLAGPIEERFHPWIAVPQAVQSILDLCTGCGCLAILLADAFPDARIDAADISTDALDVARRNVDAHHLSERIELIRSDLFDRLGGRRYDLIVSNPPYVTAASMAALPPEYRHEPRLALAGGDDGLEIVRRVLDAAGDHLTAEGALVVEIGHNSHALEAAFPRLPFCWLDTRSGECSVFFLTAAQLPRRRGRSARSRDRACRG